MGRYVLITNIWGYKAKKHSLYDSIDWKKNLFTNDYEKIEFNTIQEAREHIKLFEEVCSTYVKPEKLSFNVWQDMKDNKRIHSCYDYHEDYIFDSPDKKLWGYLLGDKETRNLVWGRDKLYKYNSKTDKRILYDILFRGEDEVPKNYVWHEGEYEGWLQYRWGDGKNAIGYVEEKKPKKEKDDIDKELDYEIESINDLYYNTDEIENQYLKEEDQEKLKRLMDRW